MRPQKLVLEATDDVDWNSGPDSRDAPDGPAMPNGSDDENVEVAAQEVSRNLLILRPMTFRATAAPAPIDRRPVQ